MNDPTFEQNLQAHLALFESLHLLNEPIQQAINICKDHAFDLIILESAGAGQSDASIVEHCDMSLYVMTPEYGAASQLEKINMLDFADVIALKNNFWLALVQLGKMCLE